MFQDPQQPQVAQYGFCGWLEQRGGVREYVKRGPSLIIAYLIVI
jgi:hypothetical protein